MQNQNIIPSLSTASDEQLVSLSAESLEAMEELLTRYSRLVRAAARPLFLTGGDHEDLVQEGMIGLLHAVLGLGAPGVGKSEVIREIREGSVTRSIWLPERLSAR